MLIVVLKMPMVVLEVKATLRPQGGYRGSINCIMVPRALGYASCRASSMLLMGVVSNENCDLRAMLVPVRTTSNF